MNKKAIHIKPMTNAEYKNLLTLSSQDRIHICSPRSPQGFLYFYTYYFTEQITSAFAPFHYDMMEVLWRIIQNTKDLNIEYKSDITINDFIDEIGIAGFKECAKTTLFKAFIIYVICYNLRKYINVDSVDRTNSERILFDIVLHLQTNSRLIADFGELYTTHRTSEQTDQKRITDFVTNAVTYSDGTVKGKIRVEAHTTQTDVRGRQHDGNRPDLVWLDDFETNNTIASEQMTTKVAEHIASIKSGMSAKGSWKIYSGNYISEYGNVQALIDRAKVQKEIEMFLIPIVVDGKPTWDGKYIMTDNEAIGTNKISIEGIKRKLWTVEKGDQTFMTEMMCQPIDYTTQEFRKDMFKHITMSELMEKQTVLYITIDSGGSSKDTIRKKQGEVDDTGVCFNWIDKYGNWYIKAFGRKMDSMEILELIFGYNMAYKNLENIAIEQTMFVEAIKPFYDQAKKDRQQFPNLKMLKAGGRNKENRIRGLITRFEAGQIYFIENECNDLESQLLRFPRVKHDDIMDALAYMNDIVKVPEFDRVLNRKGFYEEEETDKSPFSDIGM